MLPVEPTVLTKEDFARAEESGKYVTTITAAGMFDLNLHYFRVYLLPYIARIRNGKHTQSRTLVEKQALFEFFEARKAGKERV